MFELTSLPIVTEDLALRLKESKAGAVVIFEGWVRNHNQGKQVSRLEYQVYEQLALKEGQKILREAREKFNLHELQCTHRHGRLSIGEVAVWVGASASHRNEAFLSTRFVIDEIKHRLPIWKKEHYLNEAPVWVSCKDHTTHVHFAEEDYYQKQSSVVSQALLKSKKVLVVGLGGLGAPAATSLVQAGIGHLTLMDFDRVEISNLHRQPLYDTSDVGEKKALIAEKKLKSINPFIEITSQDLQITKNNARDAIREFDLVLDCTDNLETKYALHDACFESRIPLVSASIYRFEGQIRSFMPDSSQGCLRCFLTKTPSDETISNCNEFGVLGASVNALGSLQAGEAIQFLIHNKNASLKETIYFDFETLSLLRIKNKKRENCSTCDAATLTDSLSDAAWDIDPRSVEIKISDLDSNHELIDIRNHSESDLKHLTRSHKKIVLLCEHGIRSRRLALRYRELGLENIFSLAGGACSL